MAGRGAPLSGRRHTKSTLSNEALRTLLACDRTVTRRRALGSSERVIVEFTQIYRETDGTVASPREMRRFEYRQFLGVARHTERLSSALLKAGLGVPSSILSPMAPLGSRRRVFWLSTVLEDYWARDVESDLRAVVPLLWWFHSRPFVLVCLAWFASLRVR